MNWSSLFAAASDLEFRKIIDAANHERRRRVAPGVSSEERRLYQNGDKIAAIKAYRTRCFCTLGEAKFALEHK